MSDTKTINHNIDSEPKFNQTTEDDHPVTEEVYINNKNPHNSPIQIIISAILESIPLCLALTPWAILCGTLSIEAGMNSFQAQLMSVVVFAGAVQISGISIIGSGGSWSSLINSTTMISLRHILYSASFKNEISRLPFFKRVLFAFILTDEMFVLAKANQLKKGHFSYLYAVTVGLSFYVVWNIATFIGIFSANMIPNIDELGFDFAIAATFIAMVVPMIKNKIMFISVLFSACAALLFAYLNVEQGLIIAALIGMSVGAMLSR